jgi:hypothetical protein
MIRYLLIALLSFSSFGIYAQSYAVSLIPDDLKKNSSIVIRESHEEFTVISRKETRFKGKLAVTLMNDSAPDDYGYLILPYDKFSKVSDIKAAIYDAKGEKVIKMKQSDLLDVGTGSYSGYDDSRMKQYNPSYKNYPYTFEYEYEYSFNGSLFYPDWDPQPDANISVEKSTFIVTTPAAIPVRFKTLNTANPDSAIVDGKKIYSWHVSKLPSIEDESFSPDLQYILPSVKLAAVEFELDSYVGNMSSWNEFGKWITTLNKDRDRLDPQTEADLATLILPTDDDVAKVRKVYNYLQSKTRYVSIQLGIGGYQPFPANEVGQKGYGDCKALSNYTKAMLKKVGIESHYTLVSAGKGESDVLKDFPSTQFNHAFLCVPLKKDTIWLECTSQTNPFGYLGSFTGDRNVLLITENGGKMVRTPSYSQSDNTKIRKAVVNLSEQGDATINVSTRFKGLQFENDYIHFLIYESKNDQKKYLYEKLPLSNFTVSKFDYQVINERVPTAKEDLDIVVSGFSAKNGKRMFFQPNLLNKLDWSLPNYEERKTDVVINVPFIDIDTIEYNLSSKYFVEYLPENNYFKSEFGEYKAEFIPADGKLIYIRTFKFNKGRYPKEKYKDFSEFLRKVKTADRMKLAIVDKT